MTTEVDYRNELGSLFKAAVADHPDVMTECLSICRLYNLTPQSLFYKYEAFLMSRPSGLRTKLSTPTLDSMRELKKDIQREHQAKAVATNGVENTPTNVGGSVGVRKGKGNMADLGGFLDGLTTPSRPTKSRPSNGLPSRLSNTSNNANLPSPSFSPSHAFATPTRDSPQATSSSYRPGPSKLGIPGGDLLSTPLGKAGSHSGPSSPVSDAGSPSSLTPQPTQPFHLRPQPHSLVETLNPHLPSTRSPVTTPKPRVLLSSTSNPKNWDYRYMFEKISQRSESLDDLIDDYAEVIKEAYGVNEMGDPHFVSEDSVHTVGRILSTQTDSTKVTANSLVLESSRLLGGGKRINLRFTGGQPKVRGGAAGVKGFGLFPGCLVCVKGRNGGGGVFVVEEVLMPPPSALAQTPASELLDFQHGEKLAGEPMSFVVSAGPYTLDDDLLYHPLSALAEVVIEEKPDVLIMLGPFLDSSHPLIASGSVTQFPNDIFRDQISARLQRIVDSSPGTVIILVPSVKDMVSKHVAFPQAMLDREPLGLPKRVRLLPNPCTFSINEVVVSLSSVDVLFHLRREEFFQKAEEADPDAAAAQTADKDSMANLVRHVLGQRSFYPIFPPPESVAGEVNLDVTHSSLVRMEGPAPDLLILPSRLKHFSKIVDSTLVVNPSHLSKPHSAGTFAKIIVHPMKRSELESEGMDVDGLEDEKEHMLWERARSEIWRI